MMMRNSLLAAVAIVAGGALAKFAHPSNAPVDRIVKNLTSWVKSHPKDASAHFSLARAHGLAFALQSSQLMIYGDVEKDDREIGVGDDYVQKTYGIAKGTGVPIPTAKELAGHLDKGVAEFNALMNLDSKEGRYLLGFADLLDSGIARAADAGVATIPGIDDAKAPKEEVDRWNPVIDNLASADEKVKSKARDELRGDLTKAIRPLVARRADANETIRKNVSDLIMEYWRERSIDYYYDAFSLAFATEKSSEKQPMRGLSQLVSHEAAVMYLKLVENRKNNSAQDKARVKEVKAALSKLKALPPNTAMTPIVLSFEPSSTLSQLMSGQSAKFDLDGTGRSQTWSWVKPETGILCWDPDRAGKITSGRDLFGSVSWWIFFDTGYAAMDALDDNRDGCLAGDELKGLAVWFDRNSDGISDAGEVLSVESLGIA
ncbi:MAG: hypothetical protein AABZ53_17735, partial [Planctomycetota bacterium]